MTMFNYLSQCEKISYDISLDCSQSDGLYFEIRNMMTNKMILYGCEVDVQVETNMKVSFSANGSVAASGSGTLSDIKQEASAKAGLEYSKTTSTSVKEKQTLSLVIEPNSRAIIYLTGDLAVSNGYVSVYAFFYKAYGGCYEFVTLKSQYARIEKISL